MSKVEAGVVMDAWVFFMLVQVKDINNVTGFGGPLEIMKQSGWAQNTNQVHCICCQLRNPKPGAYLPSLDHVPKICIP